MNFSNIKVMVFDLDGTLYEDTHHFDYQAELLKKRLPLHKQERFEKDYFSSKEGAHPLKIGRVYDVLNDLVLVQIDNYVKEAYEWTGKRLSENEVKRLYRDEPISLNFETMLSVGDPWWVSIAIAAHHGLDGKECYDAFLETREYMMGPDFVMSPIVGLKEALEKLHKECKLVLLTNSPQPDSEAILKKLGLDKVFHLKIFDGKKPTATVERFQDIRRYFQVDYEEILSIGDNWVNEIRPVIALGCKTIFIDTYGLGDQVTADLIVSRMTEAIPSLLTCLSSATK